MCARNINYVNLTWQDYPSLMEGGLLLLLDGGRVSRYIIIYVCMCNGGCKYVRVHYIFSF